jgi:hypothetical protein
MNGQPTDEPTPVAPTGKGNPPQNLPSFADKTRFIVAGFIGGLMTPMIQLLQEFLKSHRFPSEFGLGYWLVGAALGVLGAIMVWLLKDTDAKKALALGDSDLIR